MKAFIFAAGLGTRLYPFTSNQPKALVAIEGKPMLEHIILKLKTFGITSFIINIHHFGEQIIQFLEEKQNFGCQIIISDERQKLLDTGGGLKKALTYLGKNEDLLVHNVDVWTNYNLNLLMEHHKETHSLISLLVQKRNTSRYLLFDKKEMVLKGWINKKTSKKLPPDINIEQYSAFAFNGIHIINSHALKYFQSNGKFPLIPEYLQIAQSQKITAIDITNAYWLDLGKAEQITEAEKMIRK